MPWGHTAAPGTAQVCARGKQLSPWWSGWGGRRAGCTLGKGPLGGEVGGGEETGRETGAERDRDRERERDRQRLRPGQRRAERDIDKETEGQRQGQRQRQGERGRETGTETETGPERARDHRAPQRPGRPMHSAHGEWPPTPTVARTSASLRVCLPAPALSQGLQRCRAHSKCSANWTD